MVTSHATHTVPTPQPNPADGGVAFTINVSNVVGGHSPSAANNSHAASLANALVISIGVGIVFTGGFQLDCFLSFVNVPSREERRW